MYRYEYEAISCDFGGWGLGSGNVYDIEDYRSLIDQRAAHGWDTSPRGSGEPVISRKWI